VLSLRRPERPLQISPCAVTTSSPRHSSRVLPKRTTCVPPAFVPKLPPIVQLPCEPKLKGNKYPASKQACCTFCSTQPASSVMVPLPASSLRTLFMRCRLSTICVPDASGVDPTTMPVLPPCGTMLTPGVAAQALTMAATCSVELGRTTAKATPRARPRQSARIERGRCCQIRSGRGRGRRWFAGFGVGLRKTCLFF